MEFVGHRRAADLVGRLEDRDLQALLGEIISAGQAVVAGADDQDVVHQRISTSSSAMVGWSATVASKSAFLSPAFTAIAAAWRISGASGPIMWMPTISSVAAVDDQLVERALVAAGEHVLHRPEVARCRS